MTRSPSSLLGVARILDFGTNLLNWFWGFSKPTHVSEWHSRKQSRDRFSASGCRAGSADVANDQKRTQRVGGQIGPPLRFGRIVRVFLIAFRVVEVCNHIDAGALRQSDRLLEVIGWLPIELIPASPYQHLL